MTDTAVDIVTTGSGLAGVLDQVRAKREERGVEGDASVPDQAQVQREARLGAWRRSLDDAGHTRFADWTLDQLDPADQHPEGLARFLTGLSAEDRPYNTVILTGKFGRGKTAVACAAGAAAVEAGLSPRFIPHALYLEWLRFDQAPNDWTAEQVRHRFRTCGLLVLDDLGADMENEQTEFVKTETRELVNARLQAGRPLIVTTNESKDRLTAIFGGRMAERLGEDAMVLPVTGPNRRKSANW